jgi:hypothetical protein
MTMSTADAAASAVESAARKALRDKERESVAKMLQDGLSAGLIRSRTGFGETKVLRLIRECKLTGQIEDKTRRPLPAESGVSDDEGRFS